MNNKKYESMRTFLVSGFITCSCVFTQVQAQQLSQFTPSTTKAHYTSSQPDTGIAADLIVDEELVEYTQLLQRIESDFGPFDARLEEPLLSYGDMLAQRGDYSDARAILDRALHVTRINQGLYSEAQIEIVERIIDCNVAQEQWEAVDENFRYLQLLYTRLYERGTDQWHYGIAQVSDWHIVAINNNLTSDLNDHLREANKLFTLRLAMAKEEGIVDEKVLGILRHNVETTAYHLRQQKEGIPTERIYSRLEGRYRGSDRVASLD